MLNKSSADFLGKNKHFLFIAGTGEVLPVPAPDAPNQILTKRRLIAVSLVPVVFPEIWLG